MYFDESKSVIKSISNDLISNKFELHLSSEILGAGSYACVFRGQVSVSCRQVAIKYIKKTENKADENDDPSSSLLNEIMILKNLNHRNIVQFIDYADDYNNIYLVMELCIAGDLEKMLCLRRKLHEHESKYLAAQLFKVLLFLHNKKIIHGDIKPANIMLQVRGGCENINIVNNKAFRSPLGLIVKLCDFGTSRELIDSEATPNSEQKLNPLDFINFEILGTEGYLSPEQIKEENLTSAIDMWALGVVLYRCLTGYLPYRPSASCLVDPDLKYNAALWNNISQECISCTKLLLEIDHIKRGTALQVMSHPWVDEIWL